MLQDARSYGKLSGSAYKSDAGEALADMYSQFEDFNVFVYYSTRNIMLDGVIWCLGPYVDDTREYRSFRIHLANLTRTIVRRVWRIGD